MKYQNYIDLGFERGETNCSVTEKETGYSGYYLEKKLKKGMSIALSFTDLDNPCLYIPKRGSDTFHIIKITGECVIDLCTIHQKKSNNSTALSC